MLNTSVRFSQDLQNIHKLDFLNVKYGWNRQLDFNDKISFTIFEISLNRITIALVTDKWFDIW